MAGPVSMIMYSYAKTSFAGARLAVQKDLKARSNYENYLSGICTAVCNGWQMFQNQVTLVGVVINGPVATLGKMVGPPVAPLVLAQAPGGWGEFNTGIANAFGAAMADWMASVTVSGLPWYPAFAAFPGPFAPPMPNTPVPLTALAMRTSALSSMLLKAAMVQSLSPTKRNDPYAVAVMTAMAVAIERTFSDWKTMAMVTKVMGSGPIPTFAPPYVPVGPVVNGVGNMPPGGLV